MSAVAAAIGVGAVASVGSAMIGAHAAGEAADKQSAAANYATDIQNQQFQQQRDDQAPWRAAGQQAISQMQDPSFQHSFSMSDYQADPGYAFRLQQGQAAIERSAAARGGLSNGGTIRGLTDYAQGAASQEYQNAYKRFNNDQSTRFNRLASLAGMGQTSNGQLGQAGMNMANNVGNNMMGAANAQGAAGIAGANAYGSALSGLGKAGMQYGMISQMNKQPYEQMDYSNPETGNAAGPVNYNGSYNSADAYTPAME